MTILNRVWRWSYKLKNIALKNLKVPRFSKMMVKVIPFNYGQWKKRVFEKVFCVKKGDFIYISSQV